MVISRGFGRTPGSTVFQLLRSHQTFSLIPLYRSSRKEQWLGLWPLVQGPNLRCQVYASSERAGGTQRVDIDLQVSVPGRGAGIHLENTHPELSIKPFFLVAIESQYAWVIRKAWASLSCNIFMWLPIWKRCWTADPLGKHGLQHNETRVFCQTTSRDLGHLLIRCGIFNMIWTRVLQWYDTSANGWSSFWRMVNGIQRQAANMTEEADLIAW